MFALSQFAKTHPIQRFLHTTVCFVLVYDKGLPERRIRDYDILELKPILDTVSAYLMTSDAGLICNTYYTTELGDTDCLRMFIMDTDRYPPWYAERKESKIQGR